MKWASDPSWYRYCMRRTSVRTERNFSPARNVRSMTAPSLARRSFVRTNAPPLPGLTCWNSMILKTVPSTSMWFPFLNWFVLSMSAGQCRRPRAARRARTAQSVTISRFETEVSTSQPSSVTATRSSIRTPKRPGR